MNMGQVHRTEQLIKWTIKICERVDENVWMQSGELEGVWTRLMSACVVCGLLTRCAVKRGKKLKGWSIPPKGSRELVGFQVAGKSTQSSL